MTGVPEWVFREAAAAVDPVDPGDTQRNPSFRAAVEAGWIHGRASRGVAAAGAEQVTVERAEARDEQED